MKKMYKIALTALTTAVISVSALAAPNHDHQYNHDHSKYQQSHWQQHPSSSQYRPNHQYQQHPHYGHQQNQNQYANRWKTQHQLPRMYQNSSYRVTSYQRHQLSKPARNQQWYKVDGYYLLTNVNNNMIVKVIKA